MFILCSKSLYSEILPVATTCEVVVCRIQLLDISSLIVCSIYRPPSGDCVYMEQLCKTLEEIILEFPKSIIWIAGDINLPNVDWKNNLIHGSAYPIPLYSTFLDLIETHGFTQIVDFPTRGNNILDIFCTNRPSLINVCCPLPGISDHEAISVSSATLVKLNPPSKRKIYFWSKANFSNIQQLASSLCTSFMHTYRHSTSVNDLWNAIKDIYKSCLIMVPNKESSTRFNQPWINNAVKCLSRRKQRCYN